MRTTRLGDTGIETTIIGFGCADLFRQPTRAGRARLLAAALDAGIRHFDVAPMYGLGRCETELGRFARGRRERIVIATKFGISPRRAARTLAPAQGPLHRLLSAAPPLNEKARPGQADPRAGTIGSVLYCNSGYDAVAARSSLERSLRSLGTDYVDVLFLHDPAPGDLRSDDVRSYLESAHEAGKLRAWGIAGEPATTLDAARRLGPEARILQLRRDMFSAAAPLPAPGNGRGSILFGVIARALKRISAHTASDEMVARRWSQSLGASATSPNLIASLLLRDALQANVGGPVLFSTHQPARITIAAEAAVPDAGSDSQLETLRRLVAEELLAGEAPL